MELNLEQLKKNFSTIKDIRMNVTNVFQILEHHLTKLKKTYAEFVNNNKQNLFVFGLDSFQFQSKLIDIEYADMKRLFLAINNRMYCEYYKLYRIIAEYVKENITDKKTLEMVKITNNFPVYKDLEPYKQYKFEMIQEIHENIILLLYGINQFIINKQMELQHHQRKQEIGLNINNFVTTFNYNILMTKEKGGLFMSYIEFFHNLHTKYLQRFAMKMNLMYNQVTHDIKFDDSHESSENKKKELIHDYEGDNIDKNLIKEIKRTFDDSSDTSTSETIAPSFDEIHNVENSVINEINPISTGIKMRSLFKKNVNKIMNGLKSLKMSEDINVKPSELLKSIESPKNGSNKESPKNGSSNNDTTNNDNCKNELTNNMTINHDLKLQIPPAFASKTAEEIFIEISKQCEEVTHQPSPKFSETSEMTIDKEMIEEKETIEENNITLSHDELTNVVKKKRKKRNKKK